MRVVIQRVSSAAVSIDGTEVSGIDTGLLILVGIEDKDEEADAEWLATKIASLRIFSDQEGLMNLSVHQAGGALLVVSQFTLHAKTRKGTRPSFIRAAKPDKATPLYNHFVDRLKSTSGVEVQTGEFGAAMEVALVNDGPVTILIDTQNKE